MTLKTKICGISDPDTLSYIINHNFPPQFVGFIVNYPKSKRHVNNHKLIDLLRVKKKNSFYVAVLVNPNQEVLEEIKDLPFDYYQLYDCDYNKIKLIKKNIIKKLL